MSKSDTRRQIATESALQIVYSLVYDKGIPVDKIFNFVNNSNIYKGLFDNNDVLIVMLHDDSIDEIIRVLGEKINEEN